MTTKYLIINESSFNDSTSSEVVSLHSTYNKALTALDDIAREYDEILDEDDSSFVIRDGGSTNEYYVSPIEEDE